MHNKISRFYGGAFGAAFAVVVGMPVAGAVELAAHQATYEMSLLTSRSDLQMTALKGKTSYTIRKDCEGWIASEDYIIKFDYQSGETQIIASRFLSWEEMTGQLYSFEVHEGSTFEQEQRFDGYANLPPATVRPEAFFSMQPNAAMSLPDQVYFPVAHVRELLNKADQGGGLFSAHLFFGAQPDRALKRTNSVIGIKQPVKNKDKLGQLASQAYYPIQIAYFNPDSLESVPEYEITLHMQPNGVVTYYEVKYDTFAMDAKLIDAKPLPQPDCAS